MLPELRRLHALYVVVRSRRALRCTLCWLRDTKRASCCAMSTDYRYHNTTSTVNQPRLGLTSPVQVMVTCGHRSVVLRPNQRPASGVVMAPRPVVVLVPGLQLP